MSGEEVEQSHAGEKRERVRKQRQTCAGCYQGVKAVNEEQEQGWDNKKLRGLCKATYLGCVACDKVVCDECWPHWSHRTRTSERDFSGVQ